MSILKNIYSVEKRRDAKVIRFCGIKMKKRKKVRKEEIFKLLTKMQKKLSMVDNEWQFDNIKFFVPYYPLDFIQSYIVDRNCFFEEDILQELDNYIPAEAVILDCGANIGNHTVYWLKKSPKNIERVHCFEPIKNTFDILSKNVELNNLQNCAVLHNIGLNDKASSADIANYDRENIGGASLKEGNGEITLKKLDEVELKENKIDFIKIDVEGMEYPLLNGAVNTLEKYKPLIFLESFPKNYSKVHDFMTKHNYELVKEFPDNNYLYQNKDRIIVNKNSLVKNTKEN